MHSRQWQISEAHHPRNTLSEEPLRCRIYVRDLFHFKRVVYTVVRYLLVLVHVDRKAVSVVRVVGVLIN